MLLRLRFLAILVAVVALFPSIVQAQIRVATYNTLDGPVDASEDALFSTIFEAIGIKEVNGIAKRVDVISVQEQTTTAMYTTASRMADALNALYGVDSYTSDLTGFGVDLVGIVYDESTLNLVAHTNVNTTGPRFTYRAQFRPIGYTSSEADFYLYASHFKAGSSASDITTRTSEGNFLSNNADNLGAGKNIIFTGDFNFGTYTEQGYQNLLGAGNGQGNDPKQLAFWPAQFYAGDMTQSTRTTAFGGGAGGGMDDRFDLQIVSGELLDGEGLSYIGPSSAGLAALAHSYQAFGNDGGGQWNNAINYTFVGRSQQVTVIQALYNFSDHLPVVADYQVPAVMQAILPDPSPTTVPQNVVTPLDVLVENIANVVNANGADELDYTLSVSGDLFLSGGDINDMTLALSGGNTHQVMLDTSSLGSKSGTITVSSSSMAAENSLVEIFVNFEVVAGFLEADFNQDTFVDDADLAQWEDDYGVNGDSDADNDGDSDGDDFLIWQQQYGMSTAFSAVQVVPEPSTVSLGLGLVLLWGRFKRRVTADRQLPPGSPLQGEVA